MRQRIPNLVIPSKGDGRRLAPAGSVPPEFVELTKAAVFMNTTLAHGGGADLARTAYLQSYASAYHPLADELEALAHFVRHSVIVAMNEVGSSALTTYALAQRLAKRPETADLAPHVESMRRALGRSRKRRSQKAPDPTED